MGRNFVVASQRSGFTLIEMLVSMVVLVLLIVAVSQMVNSTATLTKNSGKHMDSDSQARDVFDRLAMDFAGMVRRPDADCLFVKSTGSGGNALNDKFFFYSEAPAYFSGDAGTGATPAPQNDSTLSLVGYRVNAGLIPPYQLQRLGKGLTWTGSPNGAQGGAAVFLTFPAPSASPSPSATVSPTPSPLPTSTLAGNWSTAIGSPPDYEPTGTDLNGSDQDYRVLSSGVFRLEFCFLMKDGTLSSQPYTAPDMEPRGMQDVSAVIVAIAILDDTSRTIVTPANASTLMSHLVSALPDFAGTEIPAADTPATATNPVLMAPVWQKALNNPSFAQTYTVPQAVVSAVRVYQRYFYLNTQ